MIEQKVYSFPLDANQLHFFFRDERANAKTEYLPHAHPWGG